MSERKPKIQTRLEALGWTFNENAKMGEQWTKKAPGESLEGVIGQNTVNFAIDYTIAHADMEMERQQAIIDMG